MKPTADRSHFYLFYGTRHLKGLIELRKIEQGVIRAQLSVRDVAKQQKRQPDMGSLFDASTDLGQYSAAQQKAIAIERDARTRMLETLQAERPMRYEDLLAAMLEPFVLSQADANRIISDAHRAGLLRIEGLRPRERTPKVGQGHVITLAE